MTLLYLVRELSATSRAALLIGHNPGVADLATSLAQPPDHDDAPIRFPTAAVAILDAPATGRTCPRARAASSTTPPPPSSAPDQRVSPGGMGARRARVMTDVA